MNTSDSGPGEFADLARFDLGTMLRCSTDLRRSTAECETPEEAANAVAGYFRELFRDPMNGTRQVALARVYRLQPFETLDEAQQRFARQVTKEVQPRTPCLTLLATRGEEPEWNDRRRSRGHQAIPLLSTDFVERAPMIAQLFRALGTDIPALLTQSSTLWKTEAEKTYNVFHVPRALGSEFIPAQDFVERYRIESVVGFGGFAGGDLFAVILFTTVPVGVDAASRFRFLALDARRALAPFAINYVAVRR